MTHKQIMEYIKIHHLQVEKTLSCPVIMTMLIGSQNYKLDNETSDIDTFSLVLPSRANLSIASDPAAGEFEVNDGKCMYKDIRVALNLLKKTSPNSIEMFRSKYMLVNEDYLKVVDKFLGDEAIMSYIIHCNYNHMLSAMAGMAHQLTVRNMPAGKRYSHALRLLSMSDVFLNKWDTREILDIKDVDYSLAYAAKRDTEDSIIYKEGCEQISNYLTILKEHFNYTEEIQEKEKIGLSYIEQFQFELINEYLGRI